MLFNLNNIPKLRILLKQKQHEIGTRGGLLLFLENKLGEIWDFNVVLQIRQLIKLTMDE